MSSETIVNLFLPMQLIRFLQKLVRSSVRVELKNSTVVEGTLVQVDQGMNCHLKNVTLMVLGGEPTK